MEEISTDKTEESAVGNRGADPRKPTERQRPTRTRAPGRLIVAKGSLTCDPNHPESLRKGIIDYVDPRVPLYWVGWIVAESVLNRRRRAHRNPVVQPR